MKNLQVTDTGSNTQDQRMTAAFQCDYMQKKDTSCYSDSRVLFHQMLSLGAEIQECFEQFISLSYLFLL